MRRCAAGSSVLCGGSSGSDAGSDGVLTGVSVCCACSVFSVGLEASVAGFSLLSGAAVFGDAVDSASALSDGTSLTGSKEDAGGVLPVIPSVSFVSPLSAVVAVEASTSAPVPYAVEAGLFAQAERETTARSITRISAFLFITDYLHVWFALLLYSSRRFPAKV